MSARPQSRSPLRGRYLVQKRFVNTLLRVADFVLARLVTRSAPEPLVGRPPRRILLANGGHLGDVVIATSVLPLLQQRYPGVEIGFQIGSWSLPVLRDHPAVRWIHTVDHPKLNRSGSRGARLRRYWSTRRRALREIREIGYDVAIDLYAYTPNSAALLYQARIPTRVGFGSGGFGALYTHASEWRYTDRHVAEYHLELLRRFDPGIRAPGGLRYDLPPVSAEAEAELDRHLADRGANSGAYVLLHMGAGMALKEWPERCWTELVGRLAELGLPLVFTGSGEHQERSAERITSGMETCINLVGRLSWTGFVAATRRARLVIAIDSVAGHLAAAHDVPTVVLMSGMHSLHHWRPLSDAALPISHPVPCAPCFQSRGCASMTCIRALSVEAVYETVRRHLRTPPAPVAIETGAPVRGSSI